jgi:hypothetical protein
LYFILYKKELKNELNEAEFFSSNTTKLWHAKSRFNFTAQLELSFIVSHSKNGVAFSILHYISEQQGECLLQRMIF